ncbi:hypothetical protein [Ignatzschineria sp. LJL83]
MKNNSVSEKDLQHPTSKYDYDGITGTWLLIPAKIHILICALLLPIIIWVLPLVHFKGEFRYIFTDYRYYIAGATAIFCFASAILSIIKAKQVKQRLRPMSRVSNQVVAKKPVPSSESKAQNNIPKNNKTSDKHPKVHIGQVASKKPPQKNGSKNVTNNTEPTTSSATKPVSTDAPKSSNTSSSNTTRKRTSKTVHQDNTKSNTQSKATTSSNTEKLKKATTSKVTENTSTDIPKKANSTKKASSTPKSAKNKTTASTKSQKNSKQMQLDL